MPFKIDLHTHSFFSGDGVSSPEANVAAAKAKGLHGFALTDHNTNDGVTYLLEKGLMREDGMPVPDSKQAVELTRLEGEVARLQKDYETPRPALTGRRSRRYAARWR